MIGFERGHSRASPVIRPTPNRWQLPPLHSLNITIAVCCGALGDGGVAIDFRI